MKLPGFLSGVFFGVTGMFFRILLGLFLLPIFIQELDVDKYGLYVTLLSLYEISILLNNGINTSNISVLIEHRANPEHYLAVFNQCRLLSLAANFLTLVGLIAFWPLIIHTLKVDPSLIQIANLCFYIIVAEIALQLLSNYLKSILMSHARNKEVMLSENIFLSTYFIVGVLALKFGFGIKTFFLIRTIFAGLQFVSFIGLTRRFESALLSQGWKPNLKIMKQILGVSCHTNLVQASTVVSIKLDNLMIGSNLSISTAGIYELTLKLLGIFYAIFGKIGDCFYVVFCHNQPDNNAELLKLFYLRSSAWIALLAGSALMFQLIFFDELITYFSSGLYTSQQCLPLFLILSACVWCSALNAPTGNLLLGKGHFKFQSTSYVITAILNLIFSLLFLKLFGLVGPALGTAVTQFFQQQIVSVSKVCREYKISYFQYFRPIYLQILPIMLLELLLLLQAKKLLSHTPYYLLILVFLSVSTMTITFCAWIWTTRTEFETEFLNQKISALKIKFHIKPLPMIS